MIQAVRKCFWAEAELGTLAPAAATMSLDAKLVIVPL
jgi:hypothetical protein